MQRNTHTLQELKILLHNTSTYKEACKINNFHNRCCEYTDKLYAEIKDNTQSIRVSANKGEHWFLLCKTSDYGIVIVDPTYIQMFPDLQENMQISPTAYKNDASKDHPFFIGTREELWQFILMQEGDYPKKLLDTNWPVQVNVLTPQNLREELLLEFNVKNISSTTTGNEITEKSIVYENLKYSDSQETLYSQKTAKKKKESSNNSCFNVFQCMGKK